MNLSEIHQAAIEIARKGGQQTLQYFEKKIEIERKNDDSPVTIADRNAEQLMREEILSRFPKHGIVGEEFGSQNSGSEIQWILDPIDGTRSFIHGVPFYTTLIGILYQNEPVAGVIYAPALDQLCEGFQGGGARLNGEKCEVRSCQNLEDATFLTTDVTAYENFHLQQPLEQLLQQTKIHRTWGDAYGHMMVATGRADLMIDPELNIWDAAPLLPIMQEAGGVFCDLQGKPTIKTGNGFSCSKELQPKVIKCFQQASI